MYVLPFAQIGKKDQAKVGIKAFSLGELYSAKFPVPEGFVISAQTFTDFLKHQDLHVTIKGELGKVNLADLHSVDYASRVISDLIKAGKFSEEAKTEILQQFTHVNSDFVAVRTSAFAEDHQIAWSGELATFLHIPITDLLEKVKECWASLFSTRSLYYIIQQERDFQDVKMAVIVQHQIDAKVSGLIYTAHPVNQDKNQMVVEAGFGLGEAIADGEIVPDTYVIQREPYEIIDRNISDQGVIVDVKSDAGTVSRDLDTKSGGQQKLSDEQIGKLVELAKKIEKHYGKPVDLEWAHDESFHILQAREMKF